MRTLAQRSAQAAREIKALIAHSAVQVEAGTREVGEAGGKIRAIVQSVEQVSALVAEIAAATQEQGNGIEQVNTAVTQMDEVVQQNASLVEEAAAATASMQSEAELLLQRVARFRLQEDVEATEPGRMQTTYAQLTRLNPMPRPRPHPYGGDLKQTLTSRPA